MNRFLIYTIIVITTILFSCEKLSENKVELESDYYEMEFSINAMARGSQIFVEEVFKNNIDDLLKLNGISPGNLESVLLKEASIELLSDGAYKNFNVLNVLVITIYNDELLTKKDCESTYG